MLRFCTATAVKAAAYIVLHLHMHMPMPRSRFYPHQVTASTQHIMPWNDQCANRQDIHQCVLVHSNLQVQARCYISRRCLASVLSFCTAARSLAWAATFIHLLRQEKCSRVATNHDCKCYSPSPHLCNSSTCEQQVCACACDAQITHWYGHPSNCNTLLRFHQLQN